MKLTRAVLSSSLCNHVTANVASQDGIKGNIIGERRRTYTNVSQPDVNFDSSIEKTKSQCRAKFML